MPDLTGWTHFQPDTLLISRSHYAHVPGGCTHHTEADILTGSNWGWVPSFAPASWLRISAANPVQATAGNTSRTATKRCTDCTRNIRGGETCRYEAGAADTLGGGIVGG
jgi:hypothetical protein